MLMMMDALHCILYTDFVQYYSLVAVPSTVVIVKERGLAISAEMWTQISTIPSLSTAKIRCAASPTVTPK